MRSVSMRKPNHDGEGVLAYALKIVSLPGKHEGLYWPTEADDNSSPLGGVFVNRVRAVRRMPATMGTRARRCL